MKRFFILLSCMFASPANSQVASTPSIQLALQQRLMNEIATSLRCEATAITSQEQLATAQARIKVLEDKYEPKEAK